MERGIVQLSDLLPVGLLADLKQPQPSPNEDKPPAPKAPRVLGDPTREPVNRQAASMFFRSNWLTKPMPPEAPKTLTVEQLRSRVVTLELQLERQKKENEKLRKENEKLKQVKPSKVEKKLEPAPIETTKPDARASVLEKLKSIK